MNNNWDYILNAPKKRDYKKRTVFSSKGRGILERCEFCGGCLTGQNNFHHKDGYCSAQKKKTVKVKHVSKLEYIQYLAKSNIPTKKIIELVNM